MIFEITEQEKQLEEERASMIFEINEQEKQLLLRALSTMIVASGVDYALQASADVLPLAARISQLKDDAPETKAE